MVAAASGLCLAACQALVQYEYPDIRYDVPEREEPKTIEQKIEYYADQHEVDVELAKGIAWCESNYIPTAKNPTSSAEGVFQFLDSTWARYCEGDKLNEDDNIKCAIYLLSEGGEAHWDASRHCWGKLTFDSR